MVRVKPKRYKAQRILMDWMKNLTRRVAKMLAYRVLMEEHPSEKELWDRMEELFPPITEITLGKAVTWAELMKEMEEEYGVPVGSHRVYQRADKAKRYDEIHPELLTLVDAAYVRVVSGRDPKRVFSKAVKEALIKQQNGVCAVCSASFTVARPEGDHKLAWSKGGKTAKENLQILCRRCNAEKGKMSAQEFKELYDEKYGHGKKKNG